MRIRSVTDDFDYNLRFLILDEPGPAGITVSGPRRERTGWVADQVIWSD